MCKCKVKAVRRARAAAAKAPPTDYRVNGGIPVPLNVKPSIKLPVRFPGILDGKDLIVVKNKLSKPPKGRNAVVVYGRMALMEEKDRDKVAARYGPLLINDPPEPSRVLVNE